MDTGEIAKNWEARGFSCELWTDPPGKVWTDVVHKADELLMLVEGQLEVESAGRNVRLGVGEEILIPARTSHTVRNIGAGEARWLYGYKLELP